MKPIVLLDVDGVLADFLGGCLRVLRRFGVDADARHVTTWRIEDALGLAAEQRHELMQAWARPGFCTRLEPYPGAVEGVHELRELARVYPVTAPMWSCPTWEHERREWLVEHFGFDRADVINTHAKHRVDGDVLVEDRADTLAAWRVARIEERAQWAHGVLWGRPYNERSDWAGIRTNSWSAVVRLAESLRRHTGPEGA